MVREYSDYRRGIVSQPANKVGLMTVCSNVMNKYELLVFVHAVIAVLLLE